MNLELKKALRDLWIGLADLLIATPLLVLLNGWVLSVLWGWFAVPVFGLPALSIPAALGVQVIVSFLTKHHRKDIPDDERIERLMFYTLRAFGWLAVGWVVQMFL